MLHMELSDGNSDSITLGVWSTLKTVKHCNERPGRESFFPSSALSKRPQQIGRKSRKLKQDLVNTRLAVKDQPLWCSSFLYPEVPGVWVPRTNLKVGASDSVFNIALWYFGPSLAMMLLRSPHHWIPYFPHLCIHLGKSCLVGSISEHVTERIC